MKNTSVLLPAFPGDHIVFGCYSSVIIGLPQWLSGKESTWNAGTTGDTGSIPGSGRSPGGGHGNTFQYSCL